MKVFQFANFLSKISLAKGSNALKMRGKKNVGYGIFLLLILVFFFSNRFWNTTQSAFKEDIVQMNNYNELLKTNQNSLLQDSLILSIERQKLVQGIEEKIVGFLYQLPDYSHLEGLEPYLEFNPNILDQIPSAVPLENGDYRLSSTYGHRIHPISKKEKKHFGIDLAAASGKHIYASASGTISHIIYSKKGYGTHIIIKHRFGFETRYGHLDKVLVRKGQKVSQHELIATVGNTGTSTGYHLHYEILKNKIKIDPMYSLNLKRSIYKTLLENGKEQ